MTIRPLRTAAVLAAAAASATFAMSGTASATNIGNQGCTPGYWKNHTSNWQEHSPQTRLGKLWTFPAELAAFRQETS